MPTTISDSAFKSLNAARISYNYCGICGYTPHTRLDEPNRARRDHLNETTERIQDHDQNQEVHV